jgi:hypothetical protein
MKAMNSLGSWIDQQQMASTAQDLVGPASLAEEFALLLTGVAAPAPKALRVDDFRVGPPLPELPPQEKVKVRNLLEEVKRRAKHSGLLGGKSPEQIAAIPVLRSAPKLAPKQGANPPEQDAILSRRGLPYFVPPMGPLATRIRALMDWLKKQVAAESMFIVDGQGCPVTDTEPSPEILAGAVVLMEAARRAARHVPTAAEGALHIDLPNGRKLGVIHTETSYGHFCLGLVTTEALSSSAADRLRRALQRTVESDGETGSGKLERC